MRMHTVACHSCSTCNSLNEHLCNTGLAAEAAANTAVRDNGIGSRCITQSVVTHTCTVHGAWLPLAPSFGWNTVDCCGYGAWLQVYDLMVYDLKGV